MGGTGGGSRARALVMSPHPDDDVISMGGTLAKLVRAGLEARRVCHELLLMCTRCIHARRYTSPESSLS